ncbi:hypothetical protein Hac_1555 [Helicobacter acinonychis str. Sheeba]|uniref:Uncharacterized protein n=1 Tax=Helicobacter acinonychis (strain Sheeba) TaxID=382638 RepID=Q17VQ5_HELAH|nr:hypothetical protein Hac_1555 [Helicobacter acinonychis str. Sheeba]
MPIQDTQILRIALEQCKEAGVNVCCVDSQSIKVGLLKDNTQIDESAVEKLS